MVLFGLFLGIVPGLLIYFIGRRTLERTAVVVSPALDRFIQLIQAEEYLQKKRHSVTSALINE